MRIGGAPIRVIRDPYPSFSAVAVDMQRNEVAVADENLLQILVYDRLANTRSAPKTEPLRVLAGDNTKIEFICGIHIDQATGDIYGINNDTQNDVVVFPRGARGDVAPARTLKPPHGTFGIAVSEPHQELFLTIQHTSAVVAYRKGATGTELPIRLLQGDATLLADPHGITVDDQEDTIYVTNHGSLSTVRPEAGAWLGSDYTWYLTRSNWPLERDFAVPGSGRILPPSVTVYPRTAAGNTAPLRAIRGPKTQLNWPSAVVIDHKRGEIFVASDTGDAILVFRKTDSGDVAPLRVLKGPRTGLKNPTGLFLDTLHDELWVANFGTHSATVYSPTATGDTPPLRTIRSGPAGSRSLMIGNPGALTYDSKREQILVPN